MSARPALGALSARLGIVPVYFDLQGREQRASDATHEALIAAMGHDGSSEEAARRSLAELSRLPLVDSVQVWREHAADRPRVLLRTGPGAVVGQLELRQEDGEVAELRLATTAGSAGALSVGLPGRPPPGYHRVHVVLEDGRVADQVLIVAPRTAPTAAEVLAGRNVYGVSANLYSVRSDQGFGFGDMAALDELVARVGHAGGDFVGLNPLHALRNRGESISPYSPVSRLWRNLLYLDVERLAHAGAGVEAGSRLLAATDREAERLRAAARIDYGAVLRVKLRLLRELHRLFVGRDRTGPDAAAFARFVRDGGRALRDYATFEALAERFSDQPDWRSWPDGYRDQGSPAVRAFRVENRESVDFHRWIQFELDRQLSSTAELARESGQRLGIAMDLAVGAPPDSADAWSHSKLVARGVSLGAPPDQFAPEGQNWGLAPIDPNRSRADNYLFWTRLLRGALRHAGGLRIDHAIGLERAFWIPDGRPGSEGAYVRQPAEDLLGVIALEARRAGAVVIGEDLGVVPRGLKQRLASWGLLSTSVLLFEREEQGFLPPERYSPRCFVTATTHDLVPLDGYVEGTDIELRGQLEAEDDASVAAALETRRQEVEQLARALDDAGLSTDAGDPPGATDAGDPPGATDAGDPHRGRVTVERAHRFLARCPAPLLALSLDDLAGEREPINLPGISTHRHPSWSRRMTRPLAEIEWDPATLAGRAREIGTGSSAQRSQNDAP